MIVRKVEARSILSRSKVFDYAVNAYVGCGHRCLYCYARFMRRFTGHREAWGEFVDMKVNAAALLVREVQRKERGRVWVSGVCDAYQPLENRYQLTRQCLAVLADRGWPVTVQTKSPLVLRDLDVLKRSAEAEVGITITTADERVRAVFEPSAPPAAERVRALRTLRDSGIRTFVMIAPLLPGAGGLPDLLAGAADRVLIDRYNYHYADWAFRKHGMARALEDAFFRDEAGRLLQRFGEAGVACRVLPPG